MKIRYLAQLLLAVAWFLGNVASGTAQDSGFRKLAPGVETTIPAHIDEDETVATHDVVELRSRPDLKWTPKFSPPGDTLHEMASQAKFRRKVHALEFTFKPLRMIDVDIPQTSGKMQRKRIWYMVYRVTNRGGHLEPEQKPDGTWIAKPFDAEIGFIPHFVLETHSSNPAERKAYLDRVLPAAIAPIQMREDPRRPLLNTVEISTKPIPLSTDRVDRSVWGVVTWEDVDPRVDFFSIYIQGLTDAFRWVDPPGGYREGDPPGTGRRFARKTLQLNFWRPGDEYHEHEGEIFYGTPPANVFSRDKGPDAPSVQKLYGVAPGIDYTWVYR